MRKQPVKNSLKRFQRKLISVGVGFYIRVDQSGGDLTDPISDIKVPPPQSKSSILKLHTTESSRFHSKECHLKISNGSRPHTLFRSACIFSPTTLGGAGK